jgi:uncharacterized protein YndB with AHSA1/START domain
VSAKRLQLTEVPSVEAGMRIRRPPPEVFRAFIDPDVTTRFWFTRSSGKLIPGETVQWEWEPLDASATVAVKEIDEDRRIVFTWGDDKPVTVEMQFTPTVGDATWVRVIETGHHGNADEIVARVIDSTAGFYQVLCALKALLEHDVVLTVVEDHVPPRWIDR